MIRYGCAWYPEQWPEERWADDLCLMRVANMNVVRVGEFAWSRMQPAEGQFDFDWIERAVDLAAEHEIAVVLGTPTATPPAWLTQAYPDVLAVEPNGRRVQHGGRCHYSVCSARYREMCRDVVTRMAERFGSHPDVIGWQIDNEYWRVSYDDEARAQFHAWLGARYGDIDALNRRWTTAYWSQEYSDWSQVPFPGDWDNPCLGQAFRRFMTRAYIGFQRVQRDAIRVHAADRQWITHNAHAHENLDWIEIVQELDLMSYDPYLGKAHVDFASFGWVNDMCRCAKQGRAHWVMETQPAFVSWSDINSAMDKGETRRLVWHHVAHGAEAVLFWQWRSALGGQEQYHGTILAPDGTPRPVYEEVARAGKELARVSEVLSERNAPSKVAVLFSHPDRWAINAQKHHRDFDPIGHLCAYYRPLREAGCDVDIVDPRFRDIDGYELVVAPQLHVASDPVVEKLSSYVRNGGHVVLGARSGFKDEDNALLPSRQPGDELRELLGACVEEFYALAGPAPVGGALGEGVVTVWAEPLRVEADDVEVLLSYGDSNGWLAGKPAVVRRQVGKGSITYCGAWLDESLFAKLLGSARDLAGVSGTLPDVPPGVEVCRRQTAEGEVIVLINHSGDVKGVPIYTPARDLLTNGMISEVLQLPADGVAVLQMEE